MKYLLTISLIFFCIAMHGQVFPVQVNTQLTPPYSPYLADYTTPGSQRLMIQLRANDVTLSDYTVKLRITIDGVGITIRTKQNIIPQPITLQGGGIPFILYGEDIIEYFNPNNLDFSGFSRKEFEKTRKLPEGVYRFTVEVLDYNRHTVVSNKGMTVAWMVLNDPPLLNLPRKDTKITILDPTNIPFTWTPRHTGSPNSAFSTEYTFRLVEIWPSNRNPYDAFLSQLPLYEVTTTQSQIIYGLAEPALIPGRKYAWQVQAKDIDGRDLFKNQGRSEVYVFQFGDEIGIPENFRKDGANASTLSLRWEPSTNGEMPEQYRVRYKAIDGEIWYETVTTQRWVTISDLQVNTAYDVQVRAEKGKQSSEYTLTKRLRTDEKKESSYSCGQLPAIPIPAGSNSLFVLTPGDIFSSSDFKIVVTEVTSAQNGMFSGRGMMPVNLMNGASIEVTFSGSINNKYELITGSVVSAYEQGSEMGQVIDEMHKIGEEKKEEQKSETEYSPQKVDITITGIIDTVYINDEGKIVVVNEEGDESTYEQKKDEKTGEVQETVIADSGGNTYTVDKDGKVTKESGNSSSLASANTKNNLINFKAAGNQLYGFDQLLYDAHANNYEKVTINGTETLVSWKSVASGSTDKVMAWSDKKENLFDEVNYQSLSGDVPKQKNENGVEIIVTSTGHEQVSEIEAYSKDISKENEKIVIGQLNVISYDPIVRNLVLVPVNGAPIPSYVSLTKELNNIFSPAIVKWNITPANNLTVELGSDGKLDDGSSGLLSNYTQEMREVIREFKDRDDIKDETYYLFFVGSGETGTKDGYMPRKKQCGFIFTQNLRQEILPKTIAHELAHGAFRLEHSFETYPALQKGTTDNLMDYSVGTRLHKYQWDLIHNPVAVWGLFEGDEEGASLCTWWYQSVSSFFSPSEADKQLETKAPIFDHVQENFDLYFNASQTDNKDISGFMGWSARKSSFSKKNNLTLVERVVKKFIDQPSPTFNLSSKGVFLSKFSIEGKEYKVGLYSELQEITLGKVQVDDLCDLVDHEIVKIVIEDEYILIAFFKEKQLQMTLQIIASDDDDAKLWLKYLVILDGGPTVLDRVKAYWSSLWENDGAKLAPEFPITKEQLENIYPNTNSERIAEVAEVLNEFSNDFKLTTKERMSHFLGQTAHESGSFNRIVEGHNYNAETIYDIFLKVKRSKIGGGKTYKYCHLITGYDCGDLAGCPDGYTGPNRCTVEPTWLTNAQGEFAQYSVWLDSGFTVKTTFVNSLDLFNLTYSCKLGNGSFNTGEGSKYRGRGFIQLTGKEKYAQLSLLWNEKFPDDKKDFAGDDYELIGTDVRVALLAAMFEWKRLEETHSSFKDALDGDLSEENIKIIGRLVNGSGTNPSNGESDRITKSNSAYENL